jgi:chromosome segregation ATPase
MSYDPTNPECRCDENRTLECVKLRDQVESLTRERDSFRRDFQAVNDQRNRDVIAFDDARNERDVARADLEMVKGERDDARSRQCNQLRAVIKQRNELSQEIVDVKRFLQGDMERGNQSLMDAAKEMMATLDRHVSSDSEMTAKVKLLEQLANELRRAI